MNKKEYMKQYRLINKERLSKQEKEYRIKNKEKVLNNYKNYCEINKQKLKTRYKKYREKNKDKILKLRKSNKDYMKQYRECNKLKLNKYSNEYRKDYNKLQAKTNPVFLLKTRIRSRLKYILNYKNLNKKYKFIEYIGCTVNELIQHFESKFRDGMSWENIGKWHIDHIIPLATAKTEEDVYKLNHYTNLQPLWAIDNIKKGSKVVNSVDIG